MRTVQIVRLPWSSFIPTVILARQARPCVPTIRPPSPSKSRATAACPANKVVAFFSNPFGNLDASRTAPLRIENALISPVPDAAQRLAGRPTLYGLHGVLRHRARRVRLAGAFGTDAHAHSLQRHEHRAVVQPGASPPPSPQFFCPPSANTDTRPCSSASPPAP